MNAYYYPFTVIKVNKLYYVCFIIFGGHFIGGGGGGDK